MARNRRTGFESDIHATRTRLKSLGTAVTPAPSTVTPHRHHASEIDYTAGNLLSAEEVQSALEEHDEEKLARSGVQPMLGNLDMNHFDINNILNAEIEEDLNFTGGVGEAQVNGVRQVHFVGDDDDGEARIDGLERVIFNDEPTKSVIENPSAIQLNPAVTPGLDTAYLEGQISHSEIEQVLQQDVGELGGSDGFGTYPDVRVTLGWGIVQWRRNGGGELPPLRLWYSSVAPNDMGTPPGASPFDRSDSPWVDYDAKALPSFGVGMHVSDEQDLWVMHRGILRGFPRELMDSPAGMPVDNDLLWATGDFGTITKVRPVYTNAPHIRVGRVIATDGDFCDIEIDVLVLPRAEALPGSVGRRWSWLMGD